MQIKDKLDKVNDNFSVQIYDNGFMIEIAGRDHEDNWASAKIMTNDIQELIVLIKEAATLVRD